MNFSFKSLLAAVLLLCSTVATAHDFEVGGIFYNITSSTEKTVEVTYKGSSYSAYSNEYTGDVTVPSTVAYNGETYCVTSIGNEAFSYCDGLTSIEIPGCVTSIGNNAFSKCSGLTSIEIPGSVTSIGRSAFYLCYGLTSIEIPGCVTSIGESAFEDCYRLTSVTIGDGVTSIGDCAFSDCSGLKSIEIPGSVTSIGESAFQYCSGLKSVTIGDGVTSIGYMAFYGCSGLTSIEIPGSVTSIGGFAFWGCSGLTSIEIPGSVTSIGGYAFCGCSGLTSIEIPGSITSIGGYAFDGCSGLTSITIPNSVTSIGGGAFSNCSGLTSIEIPGSVTSIGEYAFYDCNGLTSILVAEENTVYDSRNNCNAIIETATNTLIQGCKNTIIPGSVTSIGNNAFYGCNRLTSIEIPGSVTSIGDCAFYDCSGLTSIEIPGSVTSIGESAFSGCNRLTSIEIPGSVTSIGERAFRSCSGLTSVTIGDGVTSIGDWAFGWCSGLTSVTSLATTAPALGSYAFGLISSGATLYYPAGSDYSSWAQYFANTEEIAEPIYFSYNNGLPGGMQGNNHVWESGKISFSSATNGIRITVFATNSPDSYNGFPMVALGELEFYNANGEKINYTAADVTTNSLESSEGSLEGLCDGDYSTFYHSTWRSGTKPSDYVYVDVRFAQPLDAVNIKIVGRITGRLVPTHIGITSSGVYCPYLGTEGSCGDNARWSLENGVLTISGTGAMWDYSNYNNIAPWSSDEISRVVIEDGVTSIGKYAFSDCSGLTSIEIPGSVTSIGNGAFYNCSGLTSIEIPGSVTSIGERAFRGCSGLTSVTIGDGVTSIGDWAFCDCSGLTSIEIPGSVTNIGNNAFRGCSGLTSVTIGDGVTSIGDWAFCDCSGLTSIEIPGSVTSIGDGVFYNCDGLTSVTIGDGVTSIGDYAFSYCRGLTSIEIPGSVTSIGESAFCDCSGLTSVTSLATTAPALGSEAFYGISSDATLYYPAGSDYSSWAQYFANIEEFEIAEPAVNTIEVTSANMLAGTQALLSFNLKNEDTISGFQFDLHLPNGFSIAKDEMGDEIVYINEERISPRTHSFNTSVNNDGSQLVLVYSQSGAQVRGNEGEVISILVDVAADVAPGNYTVELRDLELVTPEAKTYDIPHSAYTLKVCAPCDANGDGTVSVSDIQMIVNMILNDSDPLENPAANANGDGKISVSDIQVVVNRILGKY